MRYLAPGPVAKSKMDLRLSSVNRKNLIGFISIIYKNTKLELFYLPISIFICVAGLSLVTDQWSNLNELITPKTIVRYFIPLITLILIVIANNSEIIDKQKYLINALVLLFILFIIYNLYLYLFYQKNAWDNYGYNELNIAIISSLFVNIIVFNLI